MCTAIFAKEKANVFHAIHIHYLQMISLYFKFLWNECNLRLINVKATSLRKSSFLFHIFTNGFFFFIICNISLNAASWFCFMVLDCRMMKSDCCYLSYDCQPLSFLFNITHNWSFFIGKHIAAE